MKTPEEIKKGLECCVIENECKNCPYRESGCGDLELEADALAYIRQLEAHLPEWISVKVRLPEIGDRVLVTDDFGVVSTGRWGTFGFDKGITIDGCSRFGCIPTVKYWMLLPELPKENEGGNDGKERAAAEGMAEEGPGSDRG